MSRILIVVLAMISATLPISATASTFHDIGTFSDAGLFGAPPISSPLDMANDGTIVGFDTAFPSVSWQWTPIDEFKELPNPDGLDIFFPDVISDDASRIVGHADGDLFIWSREDGYQRLDMPVNADHALPVFVSNSGLVVGTFRADEKRHFATWNSEGFEILDEMSADQSIDGISDDLSVALAHNSESSSFVWRRGSGFQDAPLRGRDLSADGEILVGWTLDEVQAARWDADAGLTKLGNLPGYSFGYVDSVSSNGTVAVGWAYNTNENGAELEATPFVWDPINGMRDLAIVLEGEFGLSNVEIASTRPVSVTGRSIFVSDDLKIISGARLLPNPNGKHQEIWSVKLDRAIAVTSGVLGDFNNNAALDAEDIDLMSAELRTQRNVALFDVNDDGSVNSADRQFWVKEIADSHFGDADLNGEFDSSDLVAVFAAGQYEDDLPGNSGWATGDWDGDGDFSSGDLVAAFESGSYEQGRNEPANTVPEPSTVFMLLLVSVWLPRFVGRDAAVRR